MKKHLPTCFLEGWGITNKGVLVGAFVGSSTPRPFSDTSPVRRVTHFGDFSVVETQQYRYVCLGRMGYDNRHQVAKAA